MPTDRTVLLVGSGPIQIGQAAEFDYSGAQACRALQEEGARVVLVNSNPATIMTDPEMADAVYVEPITAEAIAAVIRREKPDGIIAGLGGQTGLNVTAELAERGVLDDHDVAIMGTPLETIYATEDREQFRDRMQALDQPVPGSVTVEAVADVEDAVDQVGGLPVIMRTTYTLGGQGSGVVHDMAELHDRVERGLTLSRNHEVMITESIDGWVELEYEVMRDGADSTIVVCNMENLDPMGIHTGESMVVTPSQVIPDAGHQAMRDAALEVIRDLGIQGGCNIQFAWRDDGTPGGEYRVVEVNPRVSRSSALASKATGYPIARVTAKVALGKNLHEIENEITGETTAAFEPAIDYVVTKVPRWPKDKFPAVDFELSTAMKSTGEAMAIGRTFEESLLKALRSTEYVPAVDWAEVPDVQLIENYLERPTPDRPYAVFEAVERGYSTDEIAAWTGIEEWYVERFGTVVERAEAAAMGEFAVATEVGFTDAEAATMAAEGETDLTATGGGVGPTEVDLPGTAADPAESVETVAAGSLERTFKQVDTCAGEFAAATPYYYSSRSPAGRGRQEVRTDREVESVVIVGAGPIRIGQGVEFDYVTVHAVQALREAGIETHIVNNNPETVSTDYDTSDGLFFEPITAEEVADVIEATNADGVMVQFGGQTSVNIGDPLAAEIERRGLDCELLGTGVEAMDLAEDRDRFNALMDEIGVDQPAGGTATDEAGALDLAHEIGYSVLVRPSYVLGGRAMQVVEDDTALRSYLAEAVRVSPEKPVLIDDYLEGAIELDVDAVADGEDVLVGGVMEHLEAAGVHSGDSAVMIPPQHLNQETMARVREVVEDIATALETVGLLNVQLAVTDGTVAVLEANPRSSRTVPFVSKATGVPIARLAARVMAGASLADLAAAERIPEQVSVKEVVLPFDRLPGSDPTLGPEMKSTGEVMGTADSWPKAYEKAQMAVGKPIPTAGTALVDLTHEEFPDRASPAGRALLEGFDHHLDVVATEDLSDAAAAVQSGEIDLIVSRDRELLQVAVEQGVTYFSTYPSARATLSALDAQDEPLDVKSIAARPKRTATWGHE
ncbi:MAG: carbamoyl-phosphate synthase large subunit [Halodesulfurarchaeum sp.]